MNPIPIFVIGLNRNGTTWLGNVLSQCFDISSPYHELHYGVCEVNLYDNAKYWGDFSQLNNYINFLESYCKADVFKLLEGDQSWFRENRAENFYQFFFETIDRFTQKQGNQYWVVKLDPGFFHDAGEFDRFKKEVQKRYSTAKYLSLIHI